MIIWSIVIKFLKWFFSTSTAVITFISFLIAFFAYMYQKKEKRKYNAYLIAVEYSREIIPCLRFIMKILENKLGYDLYNLFYDKNIKKWDENELKTFLVTVNMSVENYNSLLANISIEDIEKAVFHSHIDLNHCTWYNRLIQLDSVTEVPSINFLTFVFDFLNKLEAIALALRYNLADEKIIYQSLHQTILNRMPYLYYFVAYHNTLDERRYYTNLIWLYNKWFKRDERQKRKIERGRQGYLGHKL